MRLLHKHQAYIVVATLCLTQVGCGVELSFPRREALDYFVGRPPATLTAALGRPDRVSDKGGVIDMSYIARSARVDTSQQDEVYGKDELPVGAAIEEDDCTTTFRIVGGTVQAWRLDGNACRNATYPDLSAVAQRYLLSHADEDINRRVNFDHNVWTGRSTVDKGEFQTN